MPLYEIWGYIEGDTEPFLVVVPPNTNIGRLRCMIKDETSDFLQDISARVLILSKISVVYDTVKDEIGSGKYQPDERQLLPRANPMSLVSEVWPEPPPGGHIHVFVGLPKGASSPDMGDNQPVDSDFVRDYKETFIKVKEWGAFNDYDIQGNGLRSHRRETQPPEFVADFERKLLSKPRLAPDAYDIYKSIIDHQFLDEYFGPLISPVEGQSPVESTLENQSHRQAGYLEVLHLASIAAYDWKQYWGGELGKALKEHAMNAIFLYQLSVQPSEMTTVLQSKQPWPFKLIMKRDISRDGQEEFRLFEPRSDLLVLKSGLPRLLMEVNSTPRKKWPGDLIQMLLLGSAVVRFANNFLEEFMANRNFVIFTMYIWEHGEATRYLLYQDSDNSKVYYKKATYLLHTPVERATFIRQLYNLREGLEREEENQVTEKEIERLQDKVKQHGEYYHLKSFHAKDTGNGDDDSRGAVDRDELGKHGYKVEPPAEDIVDEKGGVMKVFSGSKSHILTVYQQSDPSKRFIAKKVHEDSNELEFLIYLNAFQPKSEHIISLHESFRTQLTSWIILPKLDTVADYILFTPRRVYGKVAQVCCGLIKGVAYLHKLCIAHRDIKPDNLVVDREFCLKIIDFDVATRVENENEVFEGQCGTKGWMAPEIEEKSMYSPIKADRWSTGRVVLNLLNSFREEDTIVRAAAGKLTAHNPNQRPSMLQVAGSLSDVANVAVEKKASRCLQDTEEAGGENAKPPRAKKQKVSVLDEMVSGDIRQ